MQLLKSFLLIGLLSMLSCSTDSYIETLVQLDDLLLNDETKEFLDVYEAKDKVIMKKVLDHQYDLSSTESYPSDLTYISRDSRYAITDYWTFEKVQSRTSKYKQETKTYDGNYTGRIEREEIIFEDKDKHSIRLEASISAYIRKGVWKVRSSNFIVNYDEDCPVDYINHRTEGSTDSGKRITIVLEEMQLGPRTYYEVMRLKVISSFAHYAFYATKDDGIIRIDDFHNECIWVLDDNSENTP